MVDLLGLAEPTGLSENFLPDPASSTFDTNLSDLSVSPVLWQQYQLAAEALSERISSEDQLYSQVVPSSLQPESEVYSILQRDAWIAHFGRRAFRRSLTDAELASFAVLFDAGATVLDEAPFVGGVRASVTGFLLSPGFLYRTEGLADASAPGELSGEELASRLSYALWSTMPDESLLAAAEADGLAPETLAVEVERMLDDPRGHAMIADLHRQLLHVDAYAQIWRPSEEILGIGLYDESTPAAMQQEVYAFVDEVVYSGGTLHDLLTLPTTFANEDLAEIYGIEGIEGEELVPVALDPNQRAGLLTLSGFLAWQADMTTPNLIERGVFVNDALLCAEIPPPPASATSLPVDDEGLTLRERIDAHTSSCGGSCHDDLINPVGFAFGVYDQDGYYAPYDDMGDLIDATGHYAFEDEVVYFDGAVELAWGIAEQEQVHRCYAGHLVGYLAGVSSLGIDAALLDRLTADSMEGAAVRDLVVEIVTDPTFRSL